MSERRTNVLGFCDEILIFDGLVFILLDVVVNMGFRRFLLRGVRHLSIHSFLFHRQIAAADRTVRIVICPVSAPFPRPILVARRVCWVAGALLRSISPASRSRRQSNEHEEEGSCCERRDGEDKEERAVQIGQAPKRV